MRTTLSPPSRSRRSRQSSQRPGTRASSPKPSSRPSSRPRRRSRTPPQSLWRWMRQKAARRRVRWGLRRELWGRDCQGCHGAGKAVVLAGPATLLRPGPQELAAWLRQRRCTGCYVHACGQSSGHGRCWETSCTHLLAALGTDCPLPRPLQARLWPSPPARPQDRRSASRRKQSPRGCRVGATRAGLGRQRRRPCRRAGPSMAPSSCGPRSQVRLVGGRGAAWEGREGWLVVTDGPGPVHSPPLHQQNGGLGDGLSRGLREKELCPVTFRLLCLSTASRAALLCNGSFRRGPSPAPARRALFSTSARNSKLLPHPACLQAPSACGG